MERLKWARGSVKLAAIVRLFQRVSCPRMPALEAHDVRVVGDALRAVGVAIGPAARTATNLLRQWCQHCTENRGAQLRVLREVIRQRTATNERVVLLSLLLCAL